MSTSEQDSYEYEEASSGENENTSSEGSEAEVAYYKAEPILVGAGGDPFGMGGARVAGMKPHKAHKRIKVPKPQGGLCQVQVLKEGKKRCVKSIPGTRKKGDPKPRVIGWTPDGKPVIAAEDDAYFADYKNRKKLDPILKPKKVKDPNREKKVPTLAFLNYRNFDILKRAEAYQDGYPEPSKAQTGEVYRDKSKSQKEAYTAEYVYNRIAKDYPKYLPVLAAEEQLAATRKAEKAHKAANKGGPRKERGNFQVYVQEFKKQQGIVGDLPRGVRAGLKEQWNNPEFIEKGERAYYPGNLLEKKLKQN